MRRSLFPVFLLLAACTAPAVPQAQTATREAPSLPQSTSGSYLFTDSLSEIRFFVSSHMDMRSGAQCQVDAVDLNDKATKKLLQHLELAGVATICPTPDGHFLSVEVMDFNFDGRSDFRIMKAGTDPNHAAHRYWLFDPATTGFKPSAPLDSLYDPIFDRQRKMVSSQWMESPTHRGGSNFRFDGDKLTMVSNMEKFKEGDHERWVTWGMKDGKLQPMSEKIVPVPQR